jgi:beta-phosphoglucomutase-like phosphatase (HAD superfamily)
MPSAVLSAGALGVTVARTAGAFTVGVPREHSPADGLGAADLIISRLDDPALFERLRNARLP